MGDLVKIGLAVVVGVIVSAVAVDHCYDARWEEWEVRRDSVEQFAEDQARMAVEAAARADSLEAVADSLLGTAIAADPVIRERIVEVRAEPVPEEARPYTEPRDSVIDDLQEQSDRWRVAFEREKQAAALLREGYTRLEAANDSLRSVISDVPTPKPDWIPSFEVGAFGGICTTGKPCAGVGVGLTWKIKIPI